MKLNSTSGVKPASVNKAVVRTDLAPRDDVFVRSGRQIAYMLNMFYAVRWTEETRPGLLLTLINAGSRGRRKPRIASCRSSGVQTQTGLVLDQNGRMKTFTNHFTF